MARYAAKTRDVLAVFNRGRISKKALARTDVGRVALSAEVQTNWLPRTLGSMSLRPGMGYNGTLHGDGALIPFVYSTDDVAAIEMTAGLMRIWDNGDTLLTRPSVSSAVTNGTFTTDLAGWTDADDAGAASDWATGGFMRLEGTGAASAKRRQQVTVSGADVGTEHALRIVISRAPVVLRIGTTAGGDDIFRQAVLRHGTHSIAFTPTGNFHIELSSSVDYPVLVDSCTVEAGGVVNIPTPWPTTEACKSIRWQQSADVLFLASEGYQQRRIERRPNNSWSLVLYQSDNGPFLTENTENITLTPSALSGTITLTASRPVFQAEHVGAIFKMSSQGQLVEADISAELVYTDPIRVTGVETSRVFQVIRSGTWVGTVTLQRSIGSLGAWEDVSTYTTNGTVSHDDGFDNSIVYYRIGFNAGDYTSGTAELSLSYDVGSITGVVRVISYTDNKTVGAVVLSPLGGTEATEVWAEGAWSDKEGWPSAVAIWEGRLWWSGDGRNFGSVSDVYANFDPDYEGDAGPINRRVGEGAVNRVNWLLPLQRLIAGTDGAEHTVRSNSFDEPVTPSNYNAKAPTTKGSGQAPAVSADGRGYFINRTSNKIYELEYDGSKYDFGALDTTLLVPEIGSQGFVRLAVQMVPDMRVYAVRADGSCAILVRDAAEDVLCWVDMETDGAVEDVIVLPGDVCDRVIFRVRRVIGGVSYRYMEELACEEDCVGSFLNLQADSYVTGTGAVTGLDHLEGRTVVIWGHGIDRGTGVVSGGAVAGASYTSWVAGLPYTAQYKSAKLAGQTQLGLALTQRSRINKIGLVLVDTHAQGLQYGPDFETMDDLPIIENGAETSENTVWGQYDEGMVEFPGDWSTDNRVCLQAAAPRPCTVCAAVITIDRQDHD